jgi:hypothetical protein
MHPNQIMLNNCYAAFARLDSDATAACYAPEAQFDDEAFRCAGMSRSAACGTCCVTPPKPKASTYGS